MNVWQQLPKPFFCVAPMADVTDAPFRRLIAKYSKFIARDEVSVNQNSLLSQIPSANASVSSATHSTARINNFGSQTFVTWTEFVSADGLALAPEEGRKKLMADLMYTEAERPIVAQLFSSHPEYMEQAARLCAELGFDGIDINMGCPDKSIEKQGCGSAMIKTPNVARTIITAAKKGAGDVPVSVKTRLGYNEDEVETWIRFLLEQNIAALTVHARTRKEMSKVPARWERIKRVVEIRDELGLQTKIIGNGDVLSMKDGRAKALLSRADGIMAGRALFGNPWFFDESRQLTHELTALPTSGVDRESIITQAQEIEGVEFVTIEERLRVLVEHSYLFEELLPFKSFNILKKHYKAYCNGFPNASRLRASLMEQSSAAEVEAVVHSFISGDFK